MGGVVPPSNERINAWTSYAQLVGRIFPVATCKPPIKGSRPKLDARLPTADVIREVLHRYGAYGIWPRPGIVVVDVENIGALQQFRASCGTVRTVMISTPSGGYHLVFRDPHPTLRGQVRIFDDLDLVCPDGVPWYVLGPGSSRHDTAYEIIDGEEMLATGELPVAPGWLYALQAGRQTQRSAASLPPVGKPHDRRCLDEIAAAFPTTQKGKRHRRLLDLAVSLRAAGADRHDLIEHCGRAATSGCEPAYVEAREQQDLERVVDWTMGHVQVRARRHGDILDQAVRFAKQRLHGRVPDAGALFAAIIEFLGAQPDPVFALPQTRIGKEIGVKQYAVCRLIARAMRQGQLLRETEFYRIGSCSMLYRLAERRDEPRPAQIGGMTNPDDLLVRVIFDAERWRYTVVARGNDDPMHTTGEGSPLNLRDDAIVDRAALVSSGVLAPTPEEIQNLRRSVPYAGPNSDFEGVRLGELRARRAAAQSPSPAVVPVAAHGVSAGQPSSQTPGRRRTARRKPASAPRRWESGTRDPVAEVGALYDWTLPHAPRHDWAWPGLDDHVRAVCGISVVREDLVAIISRLTSITDVLGRGAYVEHGLALAIDVMVKKIATGRTALWRANEDLCDRMSFALRDHVPRPQRIATTTGFRTELMARPTLHHALAILVGYELITAEEICRLVADRKQADRSNPLRRQQRDSRRRRTGNDSSKCTA